MKLADPKAFTRLTPRLNITTFRLNYSPGYNTFIINRVIDDRQHPLHILQTRLRDQRRKEGLWWHATTGTELCKSSRIRTWCRRRLRNAFTGALNERGFDQYGRLVDASALQGPLAHLGRALRQHKDFSLSGSIRMHALVPLIPAKYTLVQREVTELLDLLLSCYQNEITGPRPKGRLDNRKRL
ncbi:unnamed protein product [Periconia digitata]|uniref:Uncharacterized protein n=1 Tax=Periconia digitata TaxID=1303443 RepID=A0A9W4XY90_9PLEO|nr:unnamed protein product [Periconia digitata]